MKWYIGFSIFFFFFFCILLLRCQRMFSAIIFDQRANISCLACQRQWTLRLLLHLPIKNFCCQFSSSKRERERERGKKWQTFRGMTSKHSFIILLSMDVVFQLCCYWFPLWPLSVKLFLCWCVCVLYMQEATVAKMEMMQNIRLAFTKKVCIFHFYFKIWWNRRRRWRTKKWAERRSNFIDESGMLMLLFHFFVCLLWFFWLSVLITAQAPSRQ